MPVQSTSAHIPLTKGAQNMRKVIEKPNIVETYQIGNTTVHIADNYIRTDPAEIEQILEEYEAAGMAIAVSCYKRGVIV